MVYNCKGEGHMSKQCTKPKRKQDDSWFKDKVLLVQAQASGQILHEEELAFLADPGIPEDALAEVHNHDNVDNNMINQAVQAMPSSEQSNVVNHSETEITSDSNIIPYSQYVIESQQATVQNSNSSAQQDALILSVIEQLKTQVVNCTKINLDNKSVNDTLTAELERYKEQVKVLKEGQNVDLKSNDNNSMNSPDPTLSSKPTKVEVPKELPKVRMVNTSLKKLKYHLAGFDVVVKERTTTTSITKGSWGFEHTKACFGDEIIPFAVEQHPLESKIFEVKMNQVLNENERLLEQVINKDIVNIIMNSSMDNASVNVHECKKCLKLETELLNKKNFVKKEIYDKLFRSFTTLEKHCISLEVDTQLNQEIFKETVLFQIKEKVLVITALNDDLRKLKEKALVDNDVTKHTIDPEMLEIYVEPITPKLLNKRIAHSAYIKHTQEEAAVLKDLVEYFKANYPLDHSLESVFSGCDPKEQGQKS
ncbi:hypothetical protein Tco_1119805 [Tanacetum coccineum]